MLLLGGVGACDPDALRCSKVFIVSCRKGGDFAITYAAGLTSGGYRTIPLTIRVKTKCGANDCDRRRSATSMYFAISALCNVFR